MAGACGRGGVADKTRRAMASIATILLDPDQRWFLFIGGILVRFRSKSNASTYIIDNQLNISLLLILFDDVPCWRSRIYDWAR